MGHPVCSLWKLVGKFFWRTKCSGVQIDMKGKLSYEAFVQGIYLQGVNCRGAFIPTLYRLLYCRRTFVQATFLRVAFVLGLFVEGF